MHKIKSNLKVRQPGRWWIRAICRLAGHDIRVNWPGDKVVCLRCNQKWGTV